MRVASLSVAELRARPGIKWHRYADDVLPAWIAEMDYAVPERIAEKLHELTRQAAYGYEDPALAPALAAAFASSMQRRHHWSPDPELVVPVVDLVQALFSSVAAFAGAGQGVILQMPIYPPFQNAVHEMGRLMVEAPLRDDGRRYVLDVDALDIAITRATPLLLLCNPHNPTGRVFERRELQAIASLAIEHDLIVVADEVHADLAYPGHTHVPFASLGPEVARRTVTLTSATKAYNIPGLRCGVLHFGSHELSERFRRVFPDRLLGVTHQFGKVATVVAWEQCEPWLASVLPLLDANRARLLEWVSSEGRGMRCYAPEATFLAWLDCRQLKLDRSPFEFFLEQARVALSDGAEFGPPGQGFVRLNFGTSREILDDILARMSGALAKIDAT